MSDLFVCGRRIYQHGKPTDYWKEDHTCSGCGSLTSGSLFRLIDAGAVIMPTDSSCKVLIGEAKKHKFYFQHFGLEEQFKFIRYLSSGKIKIGGKGYFLPVPFFCV